MLVASTNWPANFGFYKMLSCRRGRATLL